MEINIDKIKKIHFIGIGGIGISAIARLFVYYGKQVSGSDNEESLVTKELKELGVDIKIGQRKENISNDVDLVVYTIAIPETNEELVCAKEKGIETLSYPKMLSVISKNMLTVAVSGTHGKTTTTAMLSKILIENDLDPTVIVGSLLKDVNSNLIVGKSQYFIVEACEYKRSFLNLYPKILIITNIDNDHLDYYKNINDIQSVFRELAERVPKDGYIICNSNDENIKPVIKNLETNIVNYNDIKIDNLELKFPGQHYKDDALASFCVANILKIEKDNILKSLKNFNGTWRRFEMKGKTKNGTIVYDDYGHHPTEIKATLSGFKEMYPSQKRVVFFQPHTFSRTKLLLNEFSKSFDDADIVYILPIYKSREQFDPSISSEMLVSKIQNAKHIKDEDVCNLINTFDNNTVVLMIGAGDIYKLTESINLEN
jgi:UDP-N-acetylmuramate--alanine ligase